MGTRMASRHRGPPTTASYRFNQKPRALLGWSFHQWTGPKMRAILEYYDYKIDKSGEPVSKIDLMSHLERLNRQIKMTINDRDRILGAAGLGPPPKYDHRLSEVLRYALKDDHNLNLQDFPYVSDMLELGPPPAKSPLISEYEAVAQDYLIYLDTYRIGGIEDDTTFARIYHQTRRPQKMYTDEGRDFFIRFALYRSLLKPGNLEAFLTGNDQQKEEASDETASTEYLSSPEFAMKPSPEILSMSSRTSMLIDSGDDSAEDQGSAEKSSYNETAFTEDMSYREVSMTPSPVTLRRSTRTSIVRPSIYISSEEDDSAEDQGPIKKPTYDEIVSIQRLELEDTVSESVDKSRFLKRKRVNDSTEAETLRRQKTTHHTPAAEHQPPGPCKTCNRSFSPTPDGYTTETMRCCPECKNIVKVVKEPYHVPTICRSAPNPQGTKWIAADIICSRSRMPPRILLGMPS